MSTSQLVLYHRSALFERHDAYYFERGIEAWDGDIPWKSTSNYAIARQHAELACALVRGGAERDEVWIHEVGAGAGRFAANFLTALGRLGDEGRALLARMRYVVSDHSEKTVNEAAARPPLRDFIAAGRALPAVFDVRRADPPRTLDGRALSFRASIVIANYVACVLATAYVERAGGKWRVLHTPAAPPVQGGPLEYAWLPCALEDAFDDRFHADVITRHFDERGDGAIAYPLGFIDFLRATTHGELVIANDFGVADHHRMTASKLRPKLYGASLNHPVEFALLDRFAATAGWSIERTTDGDRPLIHALLARGALAAPARDAFRRILVTRSDGADLLDFAAAARALNQAGDYTRGARMFARALALDPSSALLHFELGQTWTHAGEPARAVECLMRGRELAGAEEHDFDFHLGTAYHGCGELDRALACFERSLERAPDAATHLNLAVLHYARGELPRAARALDAALAIDPEYEAAIRTRDAWKDAWWDSQKRGPC
jgi:Tetratricopeptide repeat